MTEFLFLMDPYATLNLATETSLLLMQSLRERGINVYWSEQSDLALRGDQLWAQVRLVQSVTPFALATPDWRPMAEFAALVQRKDPPFDAQYLHLTYLLDFLPEQVLQFNHAAAVRNFNEKLSTLHWPQFCPPSIATMSESALQEFLEQQSEIVIKPLEDCSGRGIVRVSMSMPEWREKIAAALQDNQARPRTVVAQRFIDAIAQGDKRIYLCDGQVVGMVNRIPASGGWLGNIHQGAQVFATSLTEREAQIVAAVGPWLLERGVTLVGMDVIGGYLTELNITSPSAIRQINAVMSAQVHAKLVDAMLRRVQASAEENNADALRVAVQSLPL